MTPVTAPGDDRGPGAVFRIFLRLGLTSFGGPVAHIAFFRDELVVRRRWLPERDYVDLVALCQFLPGPASSQVGMALGLRRAGYAGALAAWAGFTLPSALALIALALGLAHSGGALAAGALAGLKVAAVAVVMQAVWAMARSLCPDTPRRLLMLVAATLAVTLSGVAGQLAALLVGAAAGLAGLATPSPPAHPAAPATPGADTAGRTPGWRSGIVALVLFAALLVGLALLARVTGDPILVTLDLFYRAGALVFGGGHVVLPLLQAEVVPRGWLSADTFLAGYGAAQAVPGPLFTFAAFVGAALPAPLGGWVGGLLALVAIFTPAFLLVVGALPFWERLRTRPRAQAALAGVNAAVVGLLLAALVAMLHGGALSGLGDLALGMGALLALTAGRQSAWRVVLGCAVVGALTGPWMRTWAA
jgi:chromate transporter